MRMSNKFKLTIELVPKSSWYDNMRKALTSSDWDKLRHQVYNEYNHVCGVCGASARLNCHEIWSYNDKTHTQLLDGFIALCCMCHHVKHIGLAEVLGREGKLDFSSVVNHFCAVNKCSVGDFMVYREDVFGKWSLRSRHEWHVDLGKYTSLVPRREDCVPDVASKGDVGEFDGYWFWLRRDANYPGMHYSGDYSDSDDIGEYEEYLRHYGKWLIRGSYIRLRSLAGKLKLKVASGVIPELKYNKDPGLGYNNCVMCVYCDDRDWETVKNAVADTGASVDSWKYDRKTLDDWSPTGRLFRRAVELGSAHYTELDRKAKDIFEMVGHTFDPLDCTQVMMVGTEFGLNLSDLSFESLMECGHPVMRKIAEYRSSDEFDD